MPDAPDNEELLTQIRRWIDEAIIGIPLCPFAAAVVRADQVAFAVSEAETVEDAVRDALTEMNALLAEPEIATTLILFQRALQDFEGFLDVVFALEELLRESRADALIQLATFHPDYRFEGEDPWGVSHYTNRTPCPIIHLLRVEDVAEATARHPDPLAIPAENVRRLEAMGSESVRAMWRRFGVGDDGS